jgi:hypothetical protein
VPISRLTRLLAAALAVAAAAVVCGCSSDAHVSAGAGASAGGAEERLASDKGGAQLWTENCSRCHNLRSPDYYTPGRWALVTEHMRVRGYLTGAETRAVTAFLQAQ